MTYLKSIKEFTQIWKDKLRKEIQSMKRKPRLAIIQIGNNEASNRYIKYKIKDCEEVGIISQLFKFNTDVTTDKLITEIISIQEKVDGLIVQLPLPPQIDINKIISVIDPTKDVDGFTLESTFKPCTPLGIIKYLRYCDFDFQGKNALVIGRSNIVGKPMSRILLEENATVTVAHSYTKNLDDFINISDLIICAVGKPNFLDCSNIKIPVVDVGINFNEEGKLVGDCFNTNGAQVTPVPGGVGLLTRCALLENTVNAARKENEND